MEENASSWMKQALIRRHVIEPPRPIGSMDHRSIRFDMLGERSGTILFWIDSVELVQLNTGTKKAFVIWRANGRQCVCHSRPLVAGGEDRDVRKMD